MKPVRIIFVGLICGVVSTAHADIASVQWVRSIISAIEPPAQAQADWGQTDTTADDYIKNKPTLGSAALANVSTGVGAAGITDGGTGLVTGDQVYEYVAANAGASNFIEDSITDGTTNKAPSENAVHDALALKQDIQIGVAGDAGKAVVVANDGTMTISSSTLGSAAYRDVASSIADNETGLTTGDQVYDALATKVNTAQGNGNANKAVITDASGNITTGTISSAMITDSTIADADIASNAAIADSKIARTGTITSGNTNIPTGGAVYTAVNAKADKATTLAGYGITDAYTKTQTDTALGEKQDRLIGMDRPGPSLPSADSGKVLVVDDDGMISMGSKLATVATTGAYSDLTGTPTIPTVNDNTLTIQKNGTTIDTFTANASADKTINITMAASDVGLGNVQNVDQTNAANITSGTIGVARLPVGTTSGTVAAGDDARFDSVPTTQPSGTPPTGRVWVWFN